MIRRPLKSLVAAACLLTAAFFVAAAVRGLHAPDESLAHEAPADVRLFVEARDAPDLLIPLIEPQLWTTLAEWVGQPADPADVENWRAQIREAVKMDPQSAIRVLFSDRVAYFSPAIGSAQEALIACRPMADVQPADLLRIWKATADPEYPAGNVYRLGAGLGLTVRDRLLQFGDPVPRDGLFRRLAAASQPAAGSLAADRLYAGLLANAPPDPHAVLFVRLIPAVDRAASRPVHSEATRAAAPPEPRLLENWPGPLREASAVLLAMEREGARLQFTVITDATAPHATDGGGRPLLDALPAETLLACEVSLSPESLQAGIDQLPERHALRVALHAQPQHDLWPRLRDATRPPQVVALGAVPTHGAAPPAPAVVILLSLRDADAAIEAWSAMVNALTAGASVLAVAGGHAPLPVPASMPVGGVTMNVLELSPLLPPRVAAAIERLDLCWARDGDVLVIASHREWLRRVLEARSGDAPRLDPAAAAAAASRPMPGGTRVLIESGRLADLGAAWLAHLERTSPQVLSERWWRDRQPRAARIGIDVVEENAEQRLRIVSVAPGTPAAGRLRPGDAICGANTQRFATTQPLAEMRAALEQRPSARWVELLIERDGVERPAQLSLPFVDLAHSLRQLVAVGRVAQRVSYADQPPASAGRSGRLTIELRGERPASRPAGEEPASQP